LNKGQVRKAAVAKERILIVEDEQVVAEQLRQSLTAQGYDVVGVADSGEQAITAGGQTRPDLVVMDIMLSGSLDGISAAQHLQPLGIPVVYLTAYSDRHLLDRAQHTQPLAYVIKPAKTSELAAVIQLALFKRKREKEREQDGQKLQAASREAEEQFRLMVAGVTDYAIFTLDAAGNVNSWNRGAERINGYSTEQIMGQSYAVLFTSEDRQQHVPEAELAQARQHGSADDTRWLVRQNGERYWAEGTVTAIRDSAGVLTGFAKITRDTTEQKRTQEALRQSEERLRIALHAARTGTWHWHIPTNTDTLDENLRGLFGLRPEQEVRTIEDFYALVHREDRPRVEAAFEQTRHEGVHLDTEFRVIQSDGTERWFLDQGEVLRDSGGQPEYLTGACVDITERKQAEEKLRQTEERLSLFVNNVRDYALFQMDGEGRIVTWNSGAEHLLGYTAEEIIGQPGARIFTPEDVAAGEPQREMREAATAGRTQDERWHRRKDGTRFWCSGVVTVMHDEGGRLRGFAKVMRDETERRNAHEQLTASLGEKEVLLREIHHRVKNNLQVITSLLTLQSNNLEDEALRGIFEEACNRVRSIGEIHELLYRSPDLARIDFNAYLHRLAQHLLSFYGVDPARVQVRVAANVNLALSEAISCGLIVNELLTNSLKHGFPEARPGQIQVSLNCGGEQCILEVTDDGIGLPEDFRLEEATSLGLKLVTVLARQLRGHVRLQGNGGTRAVVVFPQTTSEQPRQQS
jgi:PAS domain S-box-containing protein